MVLTRHTLAIFSLLTSFYCNAQELKNYDLLIDDSAEFDFLYSRAESTATGAVFGGIIGAGIEEGVRGSKDREMLKQVLPHMSDTNCSNEMISSLTSKMGKKGVALNVVESKKENNRERILIELKIKECGFKLVDVDKLLVAPFVRVNMRVRQTASRKFKFDEIIYITGKKQESFAVWTSNPGTFDKEFQKALKKAGRRVANKIIYGEF